MRDVSKASSFWCECRKPIDVLPDKHMVSSSAIAVPRAFCMHCRLFHADGLGSRCRNIIDETYKSKEHAQLILVLA